MKTLKIIGISVLIAVLLVGIGSYIYIPHLLANLFLYPKRQPLVKNPGDYGMAYENIQMETTDGVALSGWFIKGQGKHVIIIGHPATFTRYGFSKEHQGLIKAGYNQDVEFLPVAKHLVNAGYSVIMYDQRNHGQSGASPSGGPHDGGPQAYQDVLAVVNYAAHHPDLGESNIGILGFCQSSLETMIAMSNSPAILENANLNAFVAVQPIAMKTFFKQYGLPSFILKRVGHIFNNAGAAIESQNPELYAQNVFVPTLFVQNVNDPWSDMENSRTIYNLIPAEKRAIWINNTEHHRFVAYNWFNEHPDELIDFFNSYMNN